MSDPSGLKELRRIPADGLWNYIPFMSETKTYVLDQRELAKITDLEASAAQATFLSEFIIAEANYFNNSGIGCDDLTKAVEGLNSIADASRDYIVAIQQWTPPFLHGDGTVDTFDFAEYEGTKPYWQSLFNAGMSGFNTGWQVALSEEAGGAITSRLLSRGRWLRKAQQVSVQKQARHLGGIGSRGRTQFCTNAQTTKELVQQGYREGIQVTKDTIIYQVPRQVGPKNVHRWIKIHVSKSGIHGVPLSNGAAKHELQKHVLSLFK
jgi:hypothetical protein